MKESVSTENVKELFVSLSPIQALSAALPAINILISSFIIGNIFGPNALAAMGFAGPYNYVVLAFANLVGMGSQLLGSKHVGAGDIDGIKETFSTTTIMCTVIGLLLASCSFLFSEQIAGLLGADGEIKIMTADYIRGYALCSAFTVFSTCILPFLQLDCAKIISTISIITQVLVNVGFNIINAYVLDLGMFGVGMASSLGSIFSVLIGAVYFGFKSNLFKFSLKSVNGNCVAEICRCGWNQALIYLLLFVRDRVFNSVAFALGGSVVMAAFTIANNISNSIGGTLQGAVFGPTAIVSSVLVGCHDVDSLREVPKLVFKIIFPFTVVVYVLIAVFAKPICFFFGAEPEFINTYALVMILFNTYFFTNTLKTIGFSIYNSLENFKIVSLCNILGLLVYPCCVFMISKWTQSLPLLYLFATISEAAVLITFALYYRIKTKEAPLSLKKFVYIPRNFAVGKGDTLALNVSKLDEISSASEKVVAFCKERGMSDKLSFYSGLCIEEIAADNILNNFPRVNKKCSLDIRVFYEDGSISIMLRDDGPAFDINNWLKLYANEDPMRSIGLKMVSKTAKEINHNNTLGLNILNIKF